MLTEEFDYPLPPDAIAQSAIEPRDAARLLVVDGLRDLRFSDLPGLLAPGDLVVVNRTRVRPCRLRGNRRDSGGSIEALLLRRLDDTRWESLLRPARRLRPGIAIDFGDLGAVVESSPDAGVAILRTNMGGADVEALLAEVGEVPLPPYFHGDLPHPDRYQTIFAETLGSSAAPTAGLHFTPAVVADLARTGIEVTEVDLGVGLDSFRPIAAPAVDDHRMHHEQFVVPEEAAEAVARTRQRRGRVVAVGTTVVRALESAAAGEGLVGATKGETGLFIKPGFRFTVVDALVTNFHAPRSTLLLLLAAFMGTGWRTVYETALARGYRFLSFGDAMLVERA